MATPIHNPHLPPTTTARTPSVSERANRSHNDCAHSHPTPHPLHPPHPNNKTIARTFDKARTFGYSLGFPRISRRTFEGNKGFFVTTYQNTPKPQQTPLFSPTRPNPFRLTPLPERHNSNPHFAFRTPHFAFNPTPTPATSDRFINPFCRSLPTLKTAITNPQGPTYIAPPTANKPASPDRFIFPSCRRQHLPSPRPTCGSANSGGQRFLDGEICFVVQTFQSAGGGTRHEPRIMRISRMGQHRQGGSLESWG